MGNLDQSICAVEINLDHKVAMCVLVLTVMIRPEVFLLAKNGRSASGSQRSGILLFP
jgi:hypothetical protein